jgi:hypothetical protein
MTDSRQRYAVGTHWLFPYKGGRHEVVIEKWCPGTIDVIVTMAHPHDDPGSRGPVDWDWADTHRVTRTVLQPMGDRS